MYSYIQGELIEKGKDRAIVETAAGIAFELFIIDSERPEFPAAGEPVKLYTHQYVREDDLRLFGFINRSNRDFFRQLLPEKGVGPSMALSILSDLGAKNFRKAVHNQDLETLKTIHGVGKKTARRLVLEMAEKLPEQPTEDVSPQEQKNYEEATEALIGLGFNKSEATKAVQAVGREADFDSVEDLIGATLSQLEASES